MSLPVREILKKELPHVLSDFLGCSTKSQSSWGIFDPQQEERYNPNDNNNQKEKNVLNHEYDFDWWEQYSHPLNPHDIPKEPRNYQDDWSEREGWDGEYSEIDEPDIFSLDELMQPPYPHEPVVQDGDGGWGRNPIVVETKAFYRPFHISDDWGIFIKQEAIEQLQRRYYHTISNWAYRHGYVIDTTKMNAFQKLMVETSFRLATLRYYAHENFHHKVEAFATRCEAIKTTPIYLTGFWAQHRKTRGNPEEAFAEAYTIQQMNEPKKKVWDKWEKGLLAIVRSPYSSSDIKTVTTILRQQIVKETKRLIRRHTPYPYCRGPRVVKQYEELLLEWRKRILQLSGSTGQGLILANQLDNSYRYQSSEGFWVVVPKGRSIPPWLSILGTL